MEIKIKDVVPELEQVITSLSMKMDSVNGISRKLDGMADLIRSYTASTPPVLSSADMEYIKSSLHGINMSLDQLRTAFSYIASKNLLSFPSSSIQHNPIGAEDTLMSIFYIPIYIPLHYLCLFLSFMI